jgi:hypothetical protein
VLWGLLPRWPAAWLNRSIVPEVGRYGNQPLQSNPLAVPPPPIPATDGAVTWETPLRQPPIAFLDVPPDHWASPALDDLSARGLLTGFPEGTFDPDGRLRRGELSAQLAQMFALPARPDPPQFTDIPADHWAAASIYRSAQMGFFTGGPEGQFEPERAVSKAELLVAIANGLSLTSTALPEAVLQRYLDRDDIPTWAIPGLVSATQAGLVVNHPDLARLQPNRPVSRAEAAVMLHQALIYLGQISAVPSPYRVNP